MNLFNVNCDQIIFNHKLKAVISADEVVIEDVSQGFQQS